jgi:hypothetical protein
VRRLD